MFDYTDGTKNDMERAQLLAEVYNCMLLRILRRKQYTANDTALSARVINSWTSLGLLDDNRTEPGQGWRKFSVMDIVFIAVLIELRKFGVSIENLKNIKQSLFMSISESDNPNTITWLEFAYIRAKQSVDDGNTYILVDNTGRAGVITERDIALNRVNGKLPYSYIYLNFNEILNDILKHKDTKIWKEDTFWLYRSELELLNTIRCSTCNEYNIKVNDDRKVTDIERKFSGSPKDMQHLNKLINNIGYGELNLTIKNGKLCYVHGKKQEKTAIAKK